MTPLTYEAIVDEILANVEVSLGILEACLGLEPTTPEVTEHQEHHELFPFNIPTIQQMNPTIQQMNPTIQQNSPPAPSGDPMLQLKSSLSPIL